MIWYIQGISEAHPQFSHLTCHQVVFNNILYLTTWKIVSFMCQSTEDTDSEIQNGFGIETVHM